MDLSIVIPTYNERENISILIPQVEDMLRREKIRGEVVVVDDDSPDRTWEAAEGFNRRYRNIRVIRRVGRRGLASAWYEGFAAAEGAYIACMDADLCHTPEDLARLYCHAPHARIIIGSRYVAGGSGMKDKSPGAIMASKCGQYLLRAILGLPVQDMTHSFRVFHR